MNFLKFSRSRFSSQIKEFFALYKGIKYGMEIDLNEKLTVSEFSNELLSKKDLLNKNFSFEYILGNRYIPGNQPINAYFPLITENNPLKIYDDKFNAENCREREIHLKNYNFEFQKYLEIIMFENGIFPRKQLNGISSKNPKIEKDSEGNYKVLDQEDIAKNIFDFPLEILKSIHNEPGVLKTKKEMISLLDLYFTCFNPHLEDSWKLEFPYKIKPFFGDRTHTVDLVLKNKSNGLVLPFTLIEENYPNLGPLALNDLHEERNQRFTYGIFDTLGNLKQLARSRFNDNRNIYIGVVTDFKYWKFCMYRRNHNKFFDAEDDQSFFVSDFFCIEVNPQTNEPNLGMVNDVFQLLKILIGVCSNDAKRIMLAKSDRIWVETPTVKV